MRKPNYTIESCQEEALKYETRKEFRKKCNSIYQFARRNKILNEICSHMKIKFIYWTKETCQEEALKYKTRSEFEKNCNSGYQFASRNNIMDEICSHMKTNFIYWTKETCQEEALKYETRSEFQKKCDSGYQFACKNKILNEICSHMRTYRFYWTKETCQEEALKYETRKEFQKNCRGAYGFAYKNNIIDEICSHMKINFIYWTKESCQEEALKYKTRSEFEKKCDSGYQFARRNNIMDEICSHMIIIKWSNFVTIEFVNTLYNELNKLSSIELISIINSNNLSVRLKRDGLYNELISSQSNSKERINIINKIKDKYDNELEDDENINNEEEYFDNKIDDTELTITDLQKTINTNSQIVYNLSDFHMFDNENIIKSFDNETLDFLLKNRIKILWNNFLNKNLTIDEIKKEKGKDNFNYIKNEFLKEYNEINNLKLPSDYKFIYKPNLMQLLTTYRLIKNKFYANWSGTGSGKTLSAILSGRIANINNTLIICNNATVEGWEKSINIYFDNNNIITDNNNLVIDNNKFNYIIFNYEKFQQKNSTELVNQLLTLNIDYIILDEVQSVKQREEDNCSIRKRNINNLRLGLQHLNNELLTLVMTATPVINNLIEAKYLIELLTGV